MVRHAKYQSGHGTGGNCYLARRSQLSNPSAEECNIRYLLLWRVRYPWPPPRLLTRGWNRPPWAKEFSCSKNTTHRGASAIWLQYREASAKVCCASSAWAHPPLPYTRLSPSNLANDRIEGLEQGQTAVTRKNGCLLTTKSDVSHVISTTVIKKCLQLDSYQCSMVKRGIPLRFRNSPNP